MKTRVDLRQSAWFSDKQLSVEFPEHWNIRLFSPPDLEVLDAEAIGKKINSPIGTVKLEDLVVKGKTVLIVCDDISRPSRTDLILPVLIRNLENRGISRTNMAILISSGTHDLMTDHELILKLGREICENFEVHLHSYKSGNVLIGKTSRGTPVYVNKKLTTYDLIVGVGGIVPHNPAGFGGGAKLILGVCGIRTILHFHQLRKGVGTGGEIENEFRLDLLEAARMAGMDFIVNSVINRNRDVIEVYSGDIDLVFRKGVDLLRKHFGVAPPETGKFDLIIADVYPFDASFAFTRKGWWPVMHAPAGCHKLVISAMPKGVGGHMVFPIPNDLRVNKILRLYYELTAFGLHHFFSKSVAIRARKLLRKMGGAVNKQQNKDNSHGSDKVKSIISMVPAHDVVYLHCAEGEAGETLKRLPYRLFSSPGEYFDYMAELTNNKALNVGFYRSSSLTFPDYNQSLFE